MVDIGVPFKAVQNDLYGVTCLLLTHSHSDHINPITLASVKKKFPRIVIIGNYEIRQQYKTDMISNSGFPIEVKKHIFEPFDGVHNVYVQGFVWTQNGERIIYATDTCSLKNAPSGPYDYLFLESNYDARKVEQIADQHVGAYSPYNSAMRHLSTQDCKSFYYLNRRNRDSKLIELHKSRRFY